MSTIYDSPHAFAATTASFAAEVLERSATVPVVVDFWAPWCGPCRVLGPALLKAVDALGGRVLLATINTDEEPSLAARFQISGIPAVKAFRDGKVVDEFVGVRDARALAAFLARLAPSAEETTLTEAARALAEEKPAAAVSALRPLVAGGALGDDLRPRAQVLLAEALLRSGAPLPEVQAALDAVDPRSAAAERAEVLAQVAAFFAAADELSADEARRRLAESGKDWEARYALAAADARCGAMADAVDERRSATLRAIDNLIEIVARNRRFRDDGARKALLALFALLGPTSELAADARRRLQVVL